MTISMKASIGEFVLPCGIGDTSKGTSSLEPALPLNSKTKGSLPVSGSRHIPRSRGQKRNWYNKHRNDKGRQSHRAQQPGENRLQDQEQHRGQRQNEPQYQPQTPHCTPVKVVLERPDYFNYNPSSGLHTPGQIYPDAYGFAPQLMGYFPTLPPSHPMLMSIPPSPPRIGQLDPSLMSLEALSAGFHKHRVWDELEEIFPLWSPPQPSVDPLKAWTRMCSSQSGYHPLYYQRSTLRPWANEFVPGRLFHPILGW